MAIFKCSVINKSGEKEKIFQEASDKKEIIEYIKNNGSTIVEIKDEKLLSFLNNISLKTNKIMTKELSIFCKQLYEIIHVGVNLTEGLQIVIEQIRNKKLRYIITDVLIQIKKGNTFHTSFLKYENIFGSLFLSLIKAGEISGKLDSVIDQMSIYYEKQYKLENAIKTAMIYPSIVLIISVIVAIFMVTQILPMFISMYENSGLILPLSTIILIKLSNIIRSYGLLILIIFTMGLVSFTLLTKRDNIKYFIDYLKLKIPLYKRFLDVVYSTRFTSMLSTLIGSGVSIVKSLDITSKSIGNLYIYERIIQIKESVRRGELLSISIEKQNCFLPLVHSMIRIGENSGMLDEILEKSSLYLTDEMDYTVKNFTSYIEPVMIIIMAIIIGFVALGIITPMFDMINVIQ